HNDCHDGTGSSYFGSSVSLAWLCHADCDELVRWYRCVHHNGKMAPPLRYHWRRPRRTHSRRNRCSHLSSLRFCLLNCTKDETPDCLRRSDGSWRGVHIDYW